MVQVAALFRSVLDDAMAVEEAEARLDEIIGDVPLANGYLHGQEGRLWVEAAAE